MNLPPEAILQQNLAKLFLSWAEYSDRMVETSENQNNRRSSVTEAPETPGNGKNIGTNPRTKPTKNPP